MQPKQQAKDARYKPTGTEKPYTKKRLKAGAQITFTIFLAFSWTDFAYFVRRRGGLCEWKSKRKMPEKKQKDSEEQNQRTAIEEPYGGF